MKLYFVPYTFVCYSFVCLSFCFLIVYNMLIILKINMALIWFFLISYENPTECWPVILLTIEYVCFWACAVFGVCIQFPPRYCYVELIGTKYTISNISYHKVNDTLYLLWGFVLIFVFVFVFVCFFVLWFVCFFVFNMKIETTILQV